MLLARFSRRDFILFARGWRAIIARTKELRFVLRMS
jgi:hypothetical protein